MSGGSPRSRKMLTMEFMEHWRLRFPERCRSSRPGREAIDPATLIRRQQSAASTDDLHGLHGFRSSRYPRRIPDTFSEQIMKDMKAGSFHFFSCSSSFFAHFFMIFMIFMVEGF